MQTATTIGNFQYAVNCSGINAVASVEVTAASSGSSGSSGTSGGSHGGGGVTDGLELLFLGALVPLRCARRRR